MTRFFILLTCLFCCQCNPSLEQTRREPVISKNQLPLGSFQLRADTMILSDPGYDLETVRRGNGAEWSNCLSGTWNAFAVIKTFRSEGNVNGELLAVHASVSEPQSLVWQESKDVIGVDSGQAGIFDPKHFHDDSIVPSDFKWSFGEKLDEPAIAEMIWYSYCCEFTIKTPGAATITGGVVSSSGYGDGSYVCYLAKNNEGRIIGIRILFVDDQGNG